MIPDTSCSEYPSDLEETVPSIDVLNLPLRGLWPNGESYKTQTNKSCRLNETLVQI